MPIFSYNLSASCFQTPYQGFTPGPRWGLAADPLSEPPLSATELRPVQGEGKGERKGENGGEAMARGLEKKEKLCFHTVLSPSSAYCPSFFYITARLQQVVDYFC